MTQRHAIIAFPPPLVTALSALTSVVLSLLVGIHRSIQVCGHSESESIENYLSRLVRAKHVYEKKKKKEALSLRQFVPFCLELVRGWPSLTTPALVCCTARAALRGRVSLWVSRVACSVQESYLCACWKLWTTRRSQYRIPAATAAFSTEAKMLQARGLALEEPQVVEKLPQPSTLIGVSEPIREWWRKRCSAPI